jgi:outer membrane biosynthesis protein TonB
MRAAADELLAIRAHDPRGLSRMITWSLTVHVIAVALVALAPRLGWIKNKPPQRVLVINLGGAPGAKAGPTTIGGRPVDRVAPEPKRPRPIEPAAAKPDVMKVPEKAAPPKKAPPPPKEQAKAPSPVTKPPTTGRQVAEGNSRAETGVTGFGTGLQIGAGGLGGVTSLTDFCCMAYLSDITGRIQEKWDAHQPTRGRVIVQFTIQRNGTVTDIDIVQHGEFLLDQASLRPFVNLQRRLPPLPPEYTLALLTLRLTFDYQ